MSAGNLLLSEITQLLHGNFLKVNILLEVMATQVRLLAELQTVEIIGWNYSSASPLLRNTVLYVHI